MATTMQKEAPMTGPGLLPVSWPRLDGVDLHARYHSECRGGDFFDGLPVRQRVLFLLTDIAGTRVRAYQVALEVQKVFRQRAQQLFEGSHVNESDAIAELAHAVNLSLIEAAHGVRFAPTFLGCFNRTLGILTYCNAGSLLALFLERGNVRVLESTGMPLGLFTHTTFEAVILAFQEGDKLLVATKGVTESRRGTSEFGVERVEQLLRDSTAESASELCETVLREAYEFANHPWSRLLGLLQGGKRWGQEDLTDLALVRLGQPSANAVSQSC
jgi:serine phosphatase RsbU (regulator of sigma subunit)